MAKRKAKPAKKRNYKLEYKRRIARAKKLGYSKSVGRGHPKKGKDGKHHEAGIRAAQFLGIKPGDDIDKIVARDARRVFGFKPKLEPGDLAVQYEEKLRELEQLRKGRFEWTDEANFIASMETLGLTEREAYSHWFSP